MSAEYGFLPGRRLSPAYKESSLKPLNDPFSLAVACLLSDVVRCVLSSTSSSYIRSSIYAHYCYFIHEICESVLRCMSYSAEKRSDDTACLAVIAATLACTLSAVACLLASVLASYNACHTATKQCATRRFSKCICLHLHSSSATCIHNSH
jgi:hypothetical protein